LDALCREAGMNALRENVNAKSVSAKHFASAFDAIKPLREAMRKRHENEKKRRLTELDEEKERIKNDELRGYG
jgi:SpoVK/Ycf46/Vps4 family AAA+-type ATPase